MKKSIDAEKIKQIAEFIQSKHFEFQLEEFDDETTLARFIIKRPTGSQTSTKTIKKSLGFDKHDQREKPLWERRLAFSRELLQWCTINSAFLRPTINFKSEKDGEYTLAPINYLACTKTETGLIDWSGHNADIISINVDDFSEELVIAVVRFIATFPDFFLLNYKIMLSSKSVSKTDVESIFDYFLQLSLQQR